MEIKWNFFYSILSLFLKYFHYSFIRLSFIN
nr:MAG TPA: hypothetical protein [Caudoviricetes sp.]